jgi:hypothetical protein
MSDATTTTDIVEAVDAVDETNVTSQSSALALIESMNKPGVGIYSSITGTNFADKLRVAAALTTSEPVDEHLNEIIRLKDFVAQAIQITDENSGEVVDAARVILIDEDGSAFHAVSVGLASALRNIVQVVGEPATWDEPISITVVREKTRKGFQVFTIKFV